MKMLKFEQKKRGSTNVCFITKVGIDQNVGICLKTIRNWSEYWNLRTKLGIDQNVEIWVLITKSFKMMYCEWKVWNQSKSWRLVAIRWELIKMLKFWVQNVKSIKMLKFERKRGVRSNVDILLQKWKSIKLLEFDWKIRNWSEYWNLRTTLRNNQNVEIWVQNDKGRLIKMSRFEWKGGNQ